MRDPGNVRCGRFMTPREPVEERVGRFNAAGGVASRPSP
jgi:hypothetical protein